MLAYSLPAHGASECTKSASLGHSEGNTVARVSALRDALLKLKGGKVDTPVFAT